ncbi:hypothetical protein CR51_02020 [Caballeronia megalochromosomata]|uniref:cation transporter n=1 Tax=Caballeronia novacaledonica TaxID=1544861 RepID=UPI00078625AA|nr:cation transporter [Caballeronia novacaledonica]KXV16040.1 hypothetical protein CR51_02020 [Caballeronia megalochromosomata]
MSCGCSRASSDSAEERKTIKIALILNLAMFVIGTVAGWAGQSTLVLSDALDMLTDAAAYALALMAFSRGLAFKKHAARWTGGVLVVLGAGMVAEVIRRWYSGSEPVGTIMQAYSVVSFAVNLYVLMRLAKYRRGEVHTRASYICTRAEVLANIAVFVSGGIVLVTGVRVVDLLVGFAIGLYNRRMRIFASNHKVTPSRLVRRAQSCKRSEVAFLVLKGCRIAPLLRLHLVAIDDSAEHTYSIWAARCGVPKCNERSPGRHMRHRSDDPASRSMCINNEGRHVCNQIDISFIIDF